MPFSQYHTDIKLTFMTTSINRHTKHLVSVLLSKLMRRFDTIGLHLAFLFRVNFAPWFLQRVRTARNAD